MRITRENTIELVRSWWLRRTAPELLVYLGLFFVLVGSWLFVELASEMLEGETQTFDNWVLHSLRTAGDPHRPIGPGWLRDFFLNITSLGGPAVAGLISVLVFGGLALLRRRFAMAVLAVSLIGGGLLTTGLKEVFGRQRPPMEFRAVQATQLSFPSGHSFISAVLYLTLGALVAQVVHPRRLKIYIIAVAMLITFLVGLSRIYLGVHYATDVLGGWCAGVIWASACLLTAHALRLRRQSRQAAGVPDSTEDPE